MVCRERRIIASCYLLVRRHTRGEAKQTTRLPWTDTGNAKHQRGYIVMLRGPLLQTMATKVAYKFTKDNPGALASLLVAKPRLSVKMSPRRVHSSRPQGNQGPSVLFPPCPANSNSHQRPTRTLQQCASKKKHPVDEAGASVDKKQKTAPTSPQKQTKKQRRK